VAELRGALVGVVASRHRFANEEQAAGAIGRDRKEAKALLHEFCVTSFGRCRLLALSGRTRRTRACRLSGEQRTSVEHAEMSANDP